MTTNSVERPPSSLLRVWLAVGLLVCGYFLTPIVTRFLYHCLGDPLHLHASAPQTFGEGSYGVSMVASLVWNVSFFSVICLVLERSPKAFPIPDKRVFRHSGLGLGTGLVVMSGAILAIWAMRAASVSYSGQTFASALQNGFVWLVLEYLGAVGEELFARASLLVVAERLLGWKGAVVVSGAVFLVEHLGNPGASWVWLFRLFLQGMLLAYAVFRTRSLWWSVAYHAGWNWVSAPLFGAVGSGYLAEGHLFNFFPTGSAWLTGGAIGPEGSCFAFLAVLTALGLLLLTTKRERLDEDSIRY